MITLTYEKVNSRNFHSAMQKFMSQALPIKAAYTIKKVAEKIDAERKAIGETFFDTIVSKYAEKNEDGSWKRPESNPQGFTFGENEAKFQEEHEAFGKNTMTIDQQPIHIEAVERYVLLSPLEVDALECIFEGLTPTTATEPPLPVA